VSEKNETCEVGYCFGQAWWNKGYATEALKKVLSFLLNDVGLFLVEAKHQRLNPASGRVMKKAGMLFEAVLKNRRYDHDTGMREDLLVYTMERDGN
jgi:ribosomal-protein-alanine N-acetyltransferase